MNGTMRTDIGILSPDSVLKYTKATDRCWADVYSAPNGATEMCSLPDGFRLSFVATSSAINERCEPSSLPLICKPSALMGGTAVFSKLGIDGDILESEPCDTGAIIMPVCVGVLVFVDVPFTSLSLLAPYLGSSPIGLHKLLFHDPILVENS